jgi:hypothetical protein
LTIWFDDSSKGRISKETVDEVILMKDETGRVIGFELLHYHPSQSDAGLAVETVVQSES